ncbi:MAG: hypothetical protein RBU29_08850 [bacterium]|nr:hypothetical protein [bacterium]
MRDYRIHRRTAFQLGGIIWAGLPWLPSAWGRAGDGIALDVLQRKSLQDYLQATAAKYDPAENMVQKTLSGAFYHTQLSSGVVHETRGSLHYAVALLDSGEPEHLETAKAILNRVIDLQDQNPANKTYGIWSWYMEEPLAKMAPPDWNWADFCGTQLLLAWMDHRQRLGQALADKVKDSILHAARSIKKRNVGPSYTNIAIMGTNVSLLVGELFGEAEFTEYGKARLRRFYDYTFEQGSFTEYNSPTYTIVAMTELIRMLMDVQDPEDRRLAQELHDFAWRHAAQHFHAPSGQWGGPHSRCYRTILTPESGAKMFLEYGLGNRGILVPPERMSLGGDYRLRYQCPEDLIPHFQSLPEPKLVVETFVKSGPVPDAVAGVHEKNHQNIIGTTYQHPLYSFGSVNASELWNQRRPWLLYWGTPDAPTSLRVRFLHDFYDYSSAQIFTEQYNHVSLTSVGFATDSGDTHISIDRINGSIQAKDLRLRFEFEGNLNTLSVAALPHTPFAVAGADRELQFQLQSLGGSFAGKAFEWKIGRTEDDKLCIDAVAYAGPERTFDFTAMNEAWLAFAFQITPKEDPLLPMHTAKAEMREGEVLTAWPIPMLDGKKCTLLLRHRGKPDKKGIVQKSYRARQLWED